MIFTFLFSWYGLATAVLTAIVIGFVFTPLPQLLMVLGGVLLLAGVLLLFIAAPYAALTLPAGAFLLVSGVRMQRKVDDQEAEKIRSDVARYSRQNEFYVGPER